MRSAILNFEVPIIDDDDIFQIQAYLDPVFQLFNVTFQVAENFADSRYLSKKFIK